MGWVLGLLICVLYCWLGLDFGLIIQGWLFRELDGWCGLLSGTLTWLSVLLIVGFGCWYVLDLLFVFGLDGGLWVCVLCLMYLLICVFKFILAGYAGFIVQWFGGYGCLMFFE